jgi:hypothetical protein
MLREFSDIQPRFKGRSPRQQFRSAKSFNVVLATIWQQDWQHQPNAASMYVVHGGIVTGLNPTALSVATTCFQYHGYGRRTGLKIRCDLLNESVMAFDGEPRHSFSRTRDTWRFLDRDRRHGTSSYLFNSDCTSRGQSDRSANAVGSSSGLSGEAAFMET